MKISPVTMSVADEFHHDSFDPQESGSSCRDPACLQWRRSGDANDAGSDIGDMRWLLLAGGREETVPVIVPRLVRGGLRCAVCSSFLAADQGSVCHAGPDWIIAHSPNGPPAADVNEESRP